MRPKPSRHKSPTPSNTAPVIPQPQARYPPTTSKVSPNQIIASAHGSQAYPKPNILQDHASQASPILTLYPPRYPPKTHASGKHNTSLKFHAPHPSKHCSISTTQIPCTKFPPAHGPLRHHSPKPLPNITSAHKHDSLRFNPLKIGNHQSIPLPRHHPTSSTST